MESLHSWLADAQRVRGRRNHVRVCEPRPVGALDFASNDYLGLSNDPRCKRAAVKAIERWGSGARASRVVAGSHPIHDELEEQLCLLAGQPTALVYSTGYAANIGVLTALGSTRSRIFMDEHVHASLHDGARLAGADTTLFTHNAVDELCHLLGRDRETRAIVVVESIYSVLGDAAPLPDLAKICADHDAVLVVDEAHGLGVVGHGRGAVHAAGLEGAENVIVTATLSKAFGAQGGVVMGSSLLREHLVNTSRAFIFDTALAPAAAGAAVEACRIVLCEPDRVETLRRNVSLMCAVLGISESAGAVQSIPVSGPKEAWDAARWLDSVGVSVGCFRPPSVPDGISRLRLTARSVFSPEQIRWAMGQVASCSVQGGWLNG